MGGSGIDGLKWSWILRIRNRNQRINLRINLGWILWLGSLSKDIFEGRTSTGREPFSLFICLDANKFVLLSFFSLMKRIYPRVSNKPLPNNAKGRLPVDVRRSTTLLLKLPILTYLITSVFIFVYLGTISTTALWCFIWLWTSKC